MQISNIAAKVEWSFQDFMGHPADGVGSSVALAGDRSGRLVLEVEYDRFDRRSAVSALRRRHAQSYSIANVVACSRADGSELRIGVSGVGPTAIRCRSVEQSREPSDVLGDVDPVDDAVASAAYRRSVLPKLVRQALDQLESA